MILVVAIVVFVVLIASAVVVIRPRKPGKDKLDVVGIDPSSLPQERKPLRHGLCVRHRVEAQLRELVEVQRDVAQAEEPQRGLIRALRGSGGMRSFMMALHASNLGGREGKIEGHRASVAGR